MAKHSGIWASLALVCASALPVLAQDAPTADTVVATVNGEAITLGELIVMLLPFVDLVLDLARVALPGVTAAIHMLGPALMVLVCWRPAVGAASAMSSASMCPGRPGLGVMSHTTP